MRRWYEPKKDRPDIAKDAPKKKGIVRFLDTLWREFFSLLKLNLLFLLFCLPVVTIPAALTAMSKVTVMMVRDENCFLWHEFWNAFKRDFGRSLLGGIAILLAAGIFALSTWFYYMLSQMNWLFIILAAASACMLLGAYFTSMYFFPMLATVELPTGKLLKNSLILGFTCFKRTLPGAFFCLLLSFCGIGLLPFSAPFVFLIQFSLVSLIGSFWVITPIEDKILGIKQTETVISQAAGNPTDHLQSAQLGDFPEMEGEK